MIPACPPTAHWDRVGPANRSAPPGWPRWLPCSKNSGLQLIELPAGNFELAAYPGLLIKDSYWRWPERNLAGNAIDFFMQVLGLTFNDAMRQITAT